MTLLDRLDYELRYVRSMIVNSGNFEKALNYLIPIVENTAEDAILDDMRYFINTLLRDIDRYYCKRRK